MLVDLPLLHYVRFAGPAFPICSHEFWGNFITGDLGCGRIHISRGRNPHQKLQLLFLDQGNIKLFKQIHLPTCAIIISNMFEASMLPYPSGAFKTGQHWVHITWYWWVETWGKKHVHGGGQRGTKWKLPFSIQTKAWAVTKKHVICCI